MNKKDYIRLKTRDKKYINSELCSTCLNCCCKKSGCDAIPLDIEPFSVEHIIELIDKGIYSISYTFGYDRKVIPIMRTREVGAGIFNFSDNHTACSLLGKNGCTLSEENRPTFALLLIPNKVPFFSKARYCKQLMSTDEFIKLWLEKIDVMKDVVHHYSKDKDFETLYWEHVGYEYF